MDPHQHHQVSLLATSSSSSCGGSISNTSPTRRRRKSHTVVENAVAGLSSGVVGTVIGYPLDLLKTRLQVTSKDAKGRKNHILKMTSNIIRQEGGIQGLFKGLMAPLVSISFISTVTFASYSWLRPQLNAQNGWDIRNAIAATLTAPIMCPITTVEGLVRTQMQVDNMNQKQYKGSWHCLKTIHQTHGSTTLFTGMTVTVMRDAAFLAAYFFVYEGMKDTLLNITTTPTTRTFDDNNNNNNNNNQLRYNNFAIPTQLAVPLAGGTAGAAAWLTSFPFDCVRAGVQGQNLDNHHHKTNNSNQATTTTLQKQQRKSGNQIFQELMKKRGFRGLYRGVSTAVMRAFIVSSSRFSAYEITLWLFDQMKE